MNGKKWAYQIKWRENQTIRRYMYFEHSWHAWWVFRSSLIRHKTVISIFVTGFLLTSTFRTFNKRLEIGCQGQTIYWSTASQKGFRKIQVLIFRRLPTTQQKWTIQIINKLYHCINWTKGTEEIQGGKRTCLDSPVVAHRDEKIGVQVSGQSQDL